MCYQEKNAEMAPLQPSHLDKMQKMLLSDDAKSFAKHSFEAWTRNLTPHLPLLSMFVAMYESLQKEDYGVLFEHKLVRVPLSIIGQDKIRYRTPIVSLLHEAVLSARMSDLSVDNFSRVIKSEYNICVLFLCSCGVVMGKCNDVANFYGSTDHCRMDILRSAIDADGNPVKEVKSWQDLPFTNMDLHISGGDLRLLKRIEELNKIASMAKADDLLFIDRELERFVQTAQASMTLRMS